MTTPSSRKKLLSLVGLLLKPSESTRVRAAAHDLAGWERERGLSGFFCTATATATATKYGHQTADASPDRRRAGILALFEPCSSSKFNTEDGSRQSDGKDATDHSVDCTVSRDPSADVLSRAPYESLDTPIPRHKGLAFTGLDSIPEASTHRPSSWSPDIQQKARGSLLRLKILGEEFYEEGKHYCVGDLFWTRHLLRSSVDGVLSSHSFPSCSSSANKPPCHDSRISDPSILINPGVLASFGRDRQNGIFLPLGEGVRPYSTSGQRILLGSEKDGEEKQEGGKKFGIHRFVSEKIWPFAQLARLDKPIGTWLLAWPCFWSICLAAPSGSFPDPVLLGLFGVGAVLLRGAGCTVNDLWDREFDKKVERTQSRPLASGSLTPFQGLSFLGFQLLLGLGILLQLNNYSRILGVSSLLLVGTYPLMKRWTFWPQAFLGLTFNWGALLGWAAVHGSLDLPVVLPLYASGICWSLVYDTIYAHQDKEDDLKIGVKSTALRFGSDTQMWLTGFGAACIANLTLAGWNCDLGWPFYAGVAAATGHLAWQVASVNIHDRLDCNSKFVSNKWYGAIVCSAIILGKLAAIPP